MRPQEIVTTKPSQDKLDATIETVGWFKAYFEEFEPYATVAINACEELLSNIPFDVNELDV